MLENQQLYELASTSLAHMAILLVGPTAAPAPSHLLDGLVSRPGEAGRGTEVYLPFAVVALPALPVVDSEPAPAQFVKEALAPAVLAETVKRE